MNKNSNSMGYKGTVVSLLCSLAIVGCGPKDEEYKEVAKDINQMTTSDISSLNDTKFIYSHTVTQLPSFLNNAVAYDIRRHASVKINLVSDGIEVRALPRDIYTSDNQSNITNWPMVLFIPGSYIDYKCQEDSYDKCINKETVNSDADVPWDKKRYFIPDLANVEQFSDGEEGIGQQFNNCMQQQGGATLVHDGSWNGSEIDLKNGIINFELQKRYTLSNSNSCQVVYRNIAGSESGTGTSSNSFATHEFYSIVAKDNLSKKEYTPVPYSHEDFARFGFFDSETENLAYISLRDRSKVQNGHRYHDYLYRWNPNRENITYYLDNNYYLPENKPYLDSAKNAIKAINIELKEAKTGVPTIILKKQGDKRFGDLRYSYITLDNFADNFNYSGLTESITDTQTGEIVASHIVMNLPMSRSTGTEGRYDTIRDTFKYLDGKLNADEISAKLTSGDMNASDTSTSQSTATADDTAYNTSSDDEALSDAERSNLAKSTQYYNALHGLETFGANKRVGVGTYDIDNGVHASTSMKVPPIPKTPEVSGDQLPPYIQTFWTENLSPIYGPDSTIWDDPDLWTGEPRHSDMLSFSELSPKNQLLMQEITGNGFYSAILTHELGHSFGLRHNFRSSVDLAHHFTKNSPFYKKVQPKIDKALGVAGDKSMQIITSYSSVMEYMADSSFYNNIYGAYDLAALRFGYAREIQPKMSDDTIFDADGPWISVKTRDNSILGSWKKEQPTTPTLGNGTISTLEKSYKMDTVRYQFCSDSDIETDFYCNKSDVALESSAMNPGGADTFKSISRQLLDGVYVSFYNQSVGGNGLSDLSALGKIFDNGDYYTSTSALIKIRHNIARAANSAGVYDADDYLNDQTCPYNFGSQPSPYSVKGLEQCTSLRFSLDSVLLYSLSALNVNDVDARVRIYQRPKPGISVNLSTPVYATDVNLNDLYNAVTDLHISYDGSKSPMTSSNDLHKNFTDEQHQELLFKVLIENNPAVINAFSMTQPVPIDARNYRVEVTPSPTASVVTPLNGINLPSDIHPQDGNLYKKIAPQWPTKLELMQDLLRTSDLDSMDHFSNLAMVDYDHKMGRTVEMFLCNSVMHTDYAQFHSSTAKEPLSYTTAIPTEPVLNNTCVQDIIQHSDITDEGAIVAAQPYAPYISSPAPGFYYENYIKQYLTYNLLSGKGNDPANKYIEPVTKSESNKHLYRHFGLSYSSAAEEGMTSRTNYLKALLKQVVLATEDGVQGSYGHSENWREYVSVHKDSGLFQGSPIYTYDTVKQEYTVDQSWMTSNEVYNPDTGKSVYIGPKNALAQKLRKRIQNTVVKLWQLNKASHTPSLVPIPDTHMSENLKLQLERDKQVLFNILPELD
ncbi:hypothetical protein [Vibrio sp. B1Z05]|uniref:hypothetical protein n=1 Tax=Vibrio sp. B1Z05 TaxID=2654980 RepID=UPI00128D626A|nr:hypothetical protein [Vibrio sp. B1Z05]MPW37215.1 hypothetical protein [Vibrio sp. B1Z05]